ncbi:MAG: aldo/keto reductase [Gammaproteobacteria bacterium]|nr:aldo/keto reductase [Gammaproteobacteria bacterium]
MRNLGGSRLLISPIIMGCWQAGKTDWGDVNDTDSIAAIKAAFDAGITTFDTAAVYGAGHSEVVLGKALSGLRDKVVIASKVFVNDLNYNRVMNSCEKSLKNLQTDYLDLYQIHWPSGSFGNKKVPIEETMRALNKLKKAGKIRAIGVSNFSLAELKAAQLHGKIDSLQPPYSLFWRQMEVDLQPYCVEHNLTILAYSALAQGLLTGKFSKDHQFNRNDIRAYNKLFQGELYQQAQIAISQLRQIASELHTKLSTLILAWTIAQPQVCAIVGARNAEQASQNAAAINLKVKPEIISKIDEIGRIVSDKLDDDLVMWDLAKARANMD